MHTGQSLRPYVTRLRHKFVDQTRCGAALDNSLLTPGGRPHTVVRCALLIIARLHNQCE